MVWACYCNNAFVPRLEKIGKVHSVNCCPGDQKVQKMTKNLGQFRHNSLIMYQSGFPQRSQSVDFYPDAKF